MKIIYNLEQKRLTYATPPKTHKKRKQHSPNTQKKKLRTNGFAQIQRSQYTKFNLHNIQKVKILLHKILKGRY